ncbi:MAG: hypothetical protein V4736_06585 [Bdellovibrionota bacterium]
MAYMMTLILSVLVVFTFVSSANAQYAKDYSNQVMDDHTHSSKSRTTGNPSATGVNCFTGNCGKNNSGVQLGDNTNQDAAGGQVDENGVLIGQ